MEGWVDGWMDGLMGEWMDRWMGGWNQRNTQTQCVDKMKALKYQYGTHQG